MTRFYLRIVLVIFLAIVASVIAFQRLAELWEDRFFKPKSIQQLHELASTLRESLTGMDEAAAEEALQVMRDERGLPIRLVKGEDLKTRLLAPVPEESEMNRLFIDLGNAQFGVLIEADDGLVRYYMKEEERHMARGLMQVFLIIGIAGFFIVRPLVKKLRAQEATIAKIADGDLSARVDINSKDALGRLSQRLNSMADRIQELLGQQRQLVQAVSHEMRTPTARIGFALEMLAEAKTDEERARRIASLNEDLGDMDALLDELLTFLRFEENVKRLDVEAVDLLAMAQRLMERVNSFRPELIMQVSTEPEGQASFPASVSRRYFPRVLENLLMNGMRHTATRVQVTLRRAGRQVFVQVDDDGPGITESDAAKIFEPFIRLDPSRDRRTGGTGLGLAISKRIMDQHQGEIHVERSEWNGARFVIVLPT